MNASSGDVASRPSQRFYGMTKDYAVGIGLLLMVVFLWTAANFITQNLFVDGGYNKPWLITYTNTAAFTIYLIPSLLRNKREGHVSGDGGHTSGYQPLRQESGEREAERSHLASSSHATALTTRETAKLAFVFSFLWFIANWSSNAALAHTTVASVTILSSMSSFTTLGLSWLFGLELMSTRKVLAVTTSFLGVVLVSLSDGKSATSAEISEVTSSVDSKFILGDCLALLSACFYAFYVTYLKVHIKDESLIDMQLFFGFVGLSSVVICWPVGIILHVTGIETFQWPSAKGAIVAILFNMFITFSSDFLYAIAVLKTTPLVVTVGLSLTIPLAVFGDFFLHELAPIQVLVGALLVLVAFVIIGRENAEESATKASTDSDITEGEEQVLQTNPG